MATPCPLPPLPRLLAWSILVHSQGCFVANVTGKPTQQVHQCWKVKMNVCSPQRLSEGSRGYKKSRIAEVNQWLFQTLSDLSSMKNPNNNATQSRENRCKLLHKLQCTNTENRAHKHSKNLVLMALEQKLCLSRMCKQAHERRDECKPRTWTDVRL